MRHLDLDLGPDIDLTDRTTRSRSDLRRRARLGVAIYALSLLSLLVIAAWLAPADDIAAPVATPVTSPWLEAR